MKSILLALLLVMACDPPPQGPQQVTYQNGYAQQGPAQPGYGYGAAAATAAPNGAVTYTPTEPAATASPQMSVIAAPTATATAAPTATQAAPTEIQTTPVPLGVQPMPLPSATTQQTQSKMATPGAGAFQCTSDAQCLLGKCNVQFGRCAYPCKSSENDCKAGNVCTASGVCLPKAAAGVKM